MSRPAPPSPPELGGDRRPAPEMDPMVADLVSRCTFPSAGSALVCAVSGGPDSLALLVLAVAAGCEVTAVHVDHGLRPGSEAEAEVVAVAARRFGSAFRAERVTVGDGPNLEARARDARRRVLGPDAATGHTMDDQAETVLANLLRGAGAHGLAAMRTGPTHPLLGLRRFETVALGHHLGLAPVEDPSNHDPRFVRNRIRHELVPLCSAIAGRDVVPVMARQAGVLAGDADLLDALASLVDGGDTRALSTAPEALARRSVRAWLTGEGPYPPPLDAVDRVLAVARHQRAATEVPGGRRVSRQAGRLTATRSRTGGPEPGPRPGDDTSRTGPATDDSGRTPVQSGRDQQRRPGDRTR